MKRFILRHTILLAALLGLICGLLINEAGAAMYASYASGSEFFLDTSGKGNPFLLPGRTLEVYDTAGRMIRGQIKAQGSGATGVSECLVNTDLSSWTGDNPNGWFLDRSEDASTYVTESPAGTAMFVTGVTTASNPFHQPKTYGSGPIYNQQSGYVYYYNVVVSGVSVQIGSMTIHAYGVGAMATISGTGTYSGYYVTTYAGGSSLPFSAANALSGVSGWVKIDSASFSRVTYPGSNGCTLSDTKVDSGFTPSSISHYRIFRPATRREQIRTRNSQILVYDSR